MHKPKFVLDDGTHKITRGFEIQTGSRILSDQKTKLKVD